MIYRIMEINTEDDTYKVVYGNRAKFKKLTDAVYDYIQNNIYEKDKPRFIQFFEDHKNKVPETLDHVYYRRVVDGEWRFAAVDFIKTTEPIVLLVVRDVEDDVKEFFEQFTKE